MNLNINRWRVELSDDDSESLLDSDYEDFDNSLFSSFAVRQNANTEHSRIPTQSSFSPSSDITFRAYFPPWKPSTKLYNLQTRFNKDILTNIHVFHVVIVLVYNIQQKQNGNYM